MIKIHFLNVGHGDCIVVENRATSRNTVIDINRSSKMDDSSYGEVSESLNGLAFSSYFAPGGIAPTLTLESKGYEIKLADPIDYMKRNGLTNIQRFISTHPHMDHISGLKALHDEISFTNFWASKHAWTNQNSLTESQKLDYRFYQNLFNGKVSGVTSIAPLEGDERDFFFQDGFRILAPNKGILNQGGNNANHISYVLLLEYAGRKIVFGGDAESMTWEYIAESYGLEISSIDILKASHHGRDSGYHQPSVSLMSPNYTIVSVGKKPSTDSSNKYRNYSDNVWSTRWKGNIVFTIEGNGSLSYQHEYER